MSKLFRVPVLVAVMGASLALCASANAAVVTVGSPLTQSFAPEMCVPACTFAQVSVPEFGTTVVAPANGVIVRWRIMDASSHPGYALRVLKRNGGLSFAGAGTSSPQTPAGSGVQTYATSLSIQAGEYIGVNIPNEGTIGLADNGGDAGLITPQLGDTSIATAEDEPVELSFNADVQPAPTITALGSTSGPTAGGTSVTISGTDFEGTSAVKFGTLPAASFTVNSESQLIAFAPAAAAGPVSVAVTTAAGTATSAQQFTSTAPVPTCIVPKLTGKKLKAAKKGLTKASCKLGKVTKKKGASAKTGKVVKQSQKAGKVLAAGSKISVKLN